MTSQPIVLLSVRSPHVERLLSGNKTVEFRRRPWRVPNGTSAILYGARHRQAIVGSVTIKLTVTGAPSAIWESYGARSGLTRREFREYFSGAGIAAAIHVSDARELDEPLTLAELRRRNPAFHVPQSYRYMEPIELSTVLNGERKALLGDAPRRP